MKKKKIGQGSNLRNTKHFQDRLSVLNFILIQMKVDGAQYLSEVFSTLQG